MDKEIPSPPPQSKVAYLLALIIITLIGAVFIVTVLWLRPVTDPLVLIAAVFAAASAAAPSVFAFLKTQETHTIVNSEFAKFKEALAALGRAEANLARQEGNKQGVLEEQMRLEHTRALLAAEKQAGPSTPVKPKEASNQ